MSAGRRGESLKPPLLSMWSSVSLLRMLFSMFFMARSVSPSRTYANIAPWRTNRAYLPSTNRCIPSLTYSSASK
jgi:hypothetical protein